MGETCVCVCGIAAGVSQHNASQSSIRPQHVFRMEPISRMKWNQRVTRFQTKIKVYT